MNPTIQLSVHSSIQPSISMIIHVNVSKSSLGPTRPSSQDFFQFSFDFSLPFAFQISWEVGRPTR